MLPLISSAQQIEECDECNCSFWAYVVDEDPKGLNVRDKPGKTGIVISRIPYCDYDAAFISVHVVDMKNGWMKIDGWTDGYVTSKFQEDAWIFGRLAETSVRGIAATMYNGPSYKEPTRGQFPGEEGFMITDCKGKWVYGSASNKGSNQLKGWLAPEGQCPNAVTTCP